MKIFRYWALETGTVRIDGGEQTVRCYGGSNVSPEDAAAQAREKISRVQKKILGDPHVFETYEAEIREEIVREIDEKAVITRNRYGAQVLNAEDLMMLDIDHPKFSILNLFRKPEDAKTRIVKMVRELAQRPAYQDCGFRIYETFQGIRVIVLGRAFDARDPATQRMMADFHCDMLYAMLCHRQNCFRARLTPKPRRMKMPGWKVKFPRNAEEERAFREWLSQYESASRNYRVCKFLEQIGSGFATEAVRVHDELAGVQYPLPLA